MLEDLVFGCCAAMWWLAVAFMLPSWREKADDPAFRGLLFVFICKAIALTLANSHVLAAIDHGLGVPNIAILLQHLTGGVAFTAAVLVVLVHWSFPPDKARRAAQIRVVAGVAAAFVLVALWLLTDTNVSGRLTHYLVANADRPSGAAYLLVYTAMFSLGLVEIVRICWRYTPSTQSHTLRIGLRLTAVGSVIYLVHPLNRAASLVADAVDLNPLSWETVSLAAIGVGTVLIVIGLPFPLWHRRVAALAGWLQSYRVYRKIRPLWRALYEAVPEIALESPGSRLGDAHYHLYRTVIEIRDGWRIVRQDLDPDIARRAEEQGRAAGCEGLELRAFVEARQLKAALAARRDGRRTEAAEVPEAYLSESFSSEVAWLTRLAEAFTRA
ncbi:MAB_1171c family putative transporter [Kutzneria buriramensis]|uniref:DUF6545 domain-containing protein n=1 Tax=Kutzneria buriramensis TaxID=1045776 RepID=A0A3E0G7S4_9PSEU|nr:MAB_1171c family putative transporter [Kutzneria buriramensis]REH18138.1 hypothetical protein BCF44_13725 [Kutzneria buriramensis]